MFSGSVSVKLAKAKKIISDSSPVLVAFSGGVDSALVLKLAVDTLENSKVLAVTGVSPSIPPEEREEAGKIAFDLGASFFPLNTKEIENTNYRANPADRCYFCKEELFSKLQELAKERGFKTILDGTNADDAKDWRPGMRAAREKGVLSPLLEAGLTKAEIREVSKSLGLSTWNKPAMPCLSSRVPYGEKITPERLARIGDSETYLRGLGFSEVRVRDHYPVARIEVSSGEIRELAGEPIRTQVIGKLKSLGYIYVTVDLSGFKSGSLNQIRV